MHMLIWIKHSLTFQKIRDYIIDPESDFQKRIVEYLESAHIEQFIDKTMTEMGSKLQDLTQNCPEYTSPVTTLPEESPSISCDCISEFFCDVCKEHMNWWEKFTCTVNDLLYLSNTHSCNKGCKNNKYGSCKARFPRQVYNETQVDPSTGALNIKKGEAWLNTFTPTLTYLMRCNTDVTSLLSGTAIKSVIAYVTDYVTKTPLKTHTMFEAVKTVFKRESEMLAGEENRRMKARKVLVKVVNSLTSQSEIGGPMACMYLLNHPDHYTSHSFQRFLWRSYVHEVQKAWETPASGTIDLVQKNPQKN